MTGNCLNNTWRTTMHNDNELLKEAILEARTLRELAMENGRHSLKKFLKEEKLPLDDFADAEMELDDLVDLIIQRGKEDHCTYNKDDEEQEEDDFGFDNRGRPYKDSRYKLRRMKSEDDIEERAGGGMRRSISDDDELIIDYGDSEDNEDEQKLGDELTNENRKRWNLLINAKTSPAFVSAPKISENERKLLLKHAGLLKQNKDSRLIKEIKDDKDFLQKRSGIKNTGVAKKVINDLNIKQKIRK